MPKIFVIFMTVLVTVVLGSAVFLYYPLATHIKEQAEILGVVEDKVRETRQYVQSLEQAEAPKPLLPSNKASAVINDITRAGKAKGLNFVSLSPQAVGFAEDGSCRYMPVDMEVEANYQGLGEFLESLSSFEAMLTVENLKLVAVKENATLLKMKLTVRLYLEPANA